MDERSRRSAVNHLVQVLGGEVRLQAKPAKAVPQNWPTLVFRAPRSDPWLIGCLLTLALVLTVTIVGVTTVVAWFSKGQQFPLWLVVLILIILLLAPGMAFMGAAQIYLSARQSKIVLKQDRLIEYQIFNYRRAFTYNQIYEIQLRGNANCRIRYYARDENGQINHHYIRGAYLTTIRNANRMAQELQSRISAPPPDNTDEMAFLDRVVGKPLLIDVGGLTLVAMVGLLGTKAPVEQWLRFIPSVILLVIWMAASLWIGVSLWREHYRHGGVLDLETD